MRKLLTLLLLLLAFAPFRAIASDGFTFPVPEHPEANHRIYHPVYNRWPPPPAVKPFHMDRHQAWQLALHLLLTICCGILPAVISARRGSRYWPILLLVAIFAWYLPLLFLVLFRVFRVRSKAPVRNGQPGKPLNVVEPRSPVRIR